MKMKYNTLLEVLTVPRSPIEEMGVVVSAVNATSAQGFSGNCGQSTTGKLL